MALFERAPNRSEPACDQGHRKQGFLLDELDLKLQTAHMHTQELESMIKRQESRTSFESVLRRELPPGLLASHSLPMSDSAIDRPFPATRRDGKPGFKALFSYFEQGALDAFNAQDVLLLALETDCDPGSSSLSNSSDDDGERIARRTKRNRAQRLHTRSKTQR